MSDQSDREALIQKIEELADSQRNILSIVSHDIKSPLNRLYALLQLLQMSASDFTEEQKNYLEKMHIVIADGLAMIRNLIDYRNLEFRSIDVLPEPIDLADFIRTSVRAFDPVATKKLIRLHVAKIPHCVLQTDRQCLQRSFDNLLSNAVKFSFSNKSVNIAAFVENSEVTIEVKDEARGFLPEERVGMFRKFQKFSTRPTGGESSTGLGLYICKMMMEKINGTVTCETTAGVGSIFRLRLPAILTAN